MVPRLIALVLLASAPGFLAGRSEREDARASANPIRKVVTMLQMMQKKVAADGELDKELHEKFMCYCKTGVANLEKSISDCETSMPEMVSKIEELEALLAQLKAEVALHQKDRQAAKDAIAEATKIREEEHKAWVEGKEAREAQIAMIEKLMKAITALEKGAYGLVQEGKTFELLQQKAGAAAVSAVQKLLLSETLSISDYNRQQLSEFLSEGSTYTPQSGEIIGMLKQMKDTMEANLTEVSNEEESKIKTFKALLKAKLKEIDALTKLIEAKLKRIGEIQVEIVMLKEDLDDCGKSVIDDKKFLADLKKGCATAQEEYEARQKMRGEEMVALADTIKVLNDDDALDLFKKTLPSASLLQVTVRSSEARRRAVAILQGARRASKHGNRVALELVAMALGSKTTQFDEVIKMIDNMVALLKEEQLEDDSKKEYCEVQIDHIEDSVKELDHDIKSLEQSIEDMKSTIATLTDEVKALGEGIVVLDKSVAEATVNRKEENEDFTQLMAANTAAAQLLKYAKNRLNKFYNPKLYKPPPKRELTEEERIVVNNGGTLAPTAAPGGIAGTGIGLAQRSHEAPPPPPKQFGAYKKKGEESNGVIAMIDGLVMDLEKEMTEAETDEKNAQEDYEEFMKDSAQKRADDSKSIEDKVANKAELSDDLVKAEAAKGDKTKELMASEEYLGTLHLECDWLLKNFDLRKEARDGEIDALGKAKAVLSGADYSLIQTSSHSLRGR